MAHTPGPWHTKTTTVGDVAIAFWTENHGYEDWIGRAYRRVGTVGDDNGRMFAAAPTMLAALQNIENDDEHMPPTVWSAIQDAISEATEAE